MKEGEGISQRTSVHNPRTRTTVGDWLRELVGGLVEGKMVLTSLNNWNDKSN